MSYEHHQSFDIRTGSSDVRGTAYSSPVGAALDAGRALPCLGLEIPSMARGSGTGGLCFLAMTFGTVTGVTSDALPMRKYRDPGCITMTLDPRRA